MEDGSGGVRAVGQAFVFRARGAEEVAANLLDEGFAASHGCQQACPIAPSVQSAQASPRAERGHAMRRLQSVF